jgi:DUF1365 family protein
MMVLESSAASGDKFMKGVHTNNAIHGRREVLQHELIYSSFILLLDIQKIA